MKRIAVALLLVIMASSLSGTAVLADDPPQEEPNINPNINPTELYVTLVPGECQIFTKTVTVNPPQPNQGNPNQTPPVIPGWFKVTPTRLPSSPNPIDVIFVPSEDKKYVVGSPWPFIVFSEEVIASPEATCGNYTVEFAFEISDPDDPNGYTENLGKQVIHITVETDAGPCPPVPELPVIVLFGTGLLGVIGYIWFRRFRNRQVLRAN